MLPFQKIDRKEIVIRKAETTGKYGCDPEKRPASEVIEYGVVNIDKPRGPTSHQVSAYVQKILGIKKSGHSGTLDPKVTGVLPVALGRATRIVQALLVAGKEYVGVMHLHKDHPEKEIRDVIEHFKGRIKQLPPVKSSVKRKSRFRKIYYFDIIEIDGADVLFRVGTQAGTYIRKLCHDIGQKLGTGAHMQELRRTRAGPFDETTLVTLQDLTDAYHYHKEGDDRYISKVIQPIENAVVHLPKVYVLDTAVDTVCHGASIASPGLAKVESDIMESEKVAIMTLRGELVALGHAKMTSKDMASSKRGFVVKTEKVFMRQGTYPKIQRVN